jgi:hypothetical protein
MAQYNNAQVRKWLTGFFENEEDFDFFAEDNFSEVFEQFAAGDSLNKKGRLVAQYCEDKQEFEQLFTLVKNEDPDRFAEFPPPDPIEAAEPTAASRPPEPAVPPQAEPTTEPAQTTSPAPVEEMPAEPSAQNQVFISYSRRDLPFVTQLYQELTARNIPTWFDQSSIEVADHWRTSIVKGIKEADVFVLVLSPESLASVNVRKEVDLAERYKKTIIPLRWIKSDIPEAFDYQLAGLQYIRFDETTSVEKFDQLADVVRRLVGGSDLEKATAGKSVAEAPLVPAIPKDEPAADSGPKKLGGLKTKRKPRLNPVALGSSVISGVLTTVGADLEQ